MQTALGQHGGVYIYLHVLYFHRYYQGKYLHMYTAPTYTLPSFRALGEPAPANVVATDHPPPSQAQPGGEGEEG